jgi:ABC-type branched-subunit amino acid transport system substrate-binding protein
MTPQEGDRVSNVRRGSARLGVALIAGAVLLTACNNTPTKKASDNPAKTTLTGTPIKVGNVADLTGVIPGLFKGAREAVEAYVAKVNAEGGIAGHPVELVTADSKITCNGAVAAYEKVLPEVVAMVGSLSGLDGCVGKVIAKYPKIPNVFQILDPRLSGIPNTFAPSPRPLGQSIGPYRYISDKHPGAVSKLGFIVNEQTAFTSTQLLSGLKTLGGAVAYTRTTNVTKQSDYTADIIKMRSSGVKWLSLDGLDITTISRVLAAAKQQNWRPEVITSAPAYDGHFFQIADKAAAEGVLLPLGTALFLGEDRATSKGVDDYLTWLEKTHPGSKADLFGINAWAASKLYFDAAIKVGPTLGSEYVMAAVGQVEKFDSNGSIAEASPGKRTPATCWIVAEIHDGKYRRLDPADKGFSCAGAEFVPLKLG